MSKIKTEISNCDLCGEVAGEDVYLRQIISVNCKSCGRIVCKDCIGYLCYLTNENIVCKHCFFSEYDYNVYTNVKDLPSPRDFFEIGPGRYNSEHWVQGNIFIKHESFELLEDIITKFHPNFLGYSINHMSRKVALEMISFLNELIESDGSKKLQKEINVSEIVFNTYKTDIIRMIKEICDSLVIFCNNSEWVRIIGI